MREYIFSVIGASFIVSSFLLFLPAGNIGKYVKVLASLCILAFMISPIANIFLSFDENAFLNSLVPESADGELMEDKYFDFLIDLGKEELEGALKETVCEKFDIAAEDLSVDVEASEKDGVFCAERVKIGLYRGAILHDPYDIEDFVKKLVGCDCDIYY